MICNLNKTRRGRRSKQWRIGKLSKHSPSGTYCPEVFRHSQQGGFVRTLIQNDQPSLPIALSLQSTQELVESTAKILKCKLNGISRRIICFLHCAPERSSGIVRLRKNRQYLTNNPFPLFLAHGFPRFSLAAVDLRSMEFYRPRIARRDLSGQLFESLRKVVSLSLENRNAPQDEVRFRGVFLWTPSRLSIIGAWWEYKKNAARWSCLQRTAFRQPSQPHHQFSPHGCKCQGELWSQRMRNHSIQDGNVAAGLGEYRVALRITRPTTTLGRGRHEGK